MEEMVKKLLIMLLGGGLVVGLSLPALAVSSVELHKLTASDADALDVFGQSVAISGSTALVGARYDDHAAGTDSGSAYLFDVATGVQLTKLTASDADAMDYFGFSVALSGSTALVGAYGNEDAGSISGSAYLFDVSDPCNPVQIAKLTASDVAAGNVFGYSVAISGTTALAGSPGNDDAGIQSGSAYLYDFTDPCNITEIKLTASDANAGDMFGISVAISGSTALVGARYDDHAAGSSSGSAYLYDFSDPCSIIEIKLTASDANAVDLFGVSVALSGSTALVGAYWDDDAGSDSGSAYLYDFNDPCNIIEIKLTASDANAEDIFGYSVAISGSTAIVGARYDDNDGTDSGSAYLFDAATGSQIAKLTASDANAVDQFGYSVAISGSTALVGALYDDDGGANSGSAYLFGFCLFPPVGDINLDCRVDLTDFALMAGNWLVDCILDPSDPACLAP